MQNLIEIFKFDQLKMQLKLNLIELNLIKIDEFNENQFNYDNLRF